MKLLYFSLLILTFTIYPYIYILIKIRTLNKLKKNYFTISDFILFIVDFTSNKFSLSIIKKMIMIFSLFLFFIFCLPPIFSYVITVGGISSFTR